MKQRKGKFTLGMKIASILSCIALVSVGFASWWIIRLPSPETKGGSFEVYSVDEKKINYTDVKFVTEAGAEDTTPKIIFGYKDDDSVTAPWLGYSTTGADKMAAENLSAILQFKISLEKPVSGDKISNYMQKINIALTIPATYKSLLTTGTAGYVAAPKMSYRNGSTGDWVSLNATVNDDVYSVVIDAPQATEQTIQVKFEFDWAYYHNNAVQNENPYVYFNKIQGGYTPELAKDAMDVLEKVETIGSATFSVKLSSTPEGPAKTEQ